MRSAPTILLSIALAIGAGLFYLNRQGRSPTGQAPLVEITGPDPAAFSAGFNRAKSSVRLVLLLSPT